MGGDADVAQAAYEAFGRGDIEAVLGMLAPDVEWSAPRTLPQGGQSKARTGCSPSSRASAGRGSRSPEALGG